MSHFICLHLYYVFQKLKKSKRKTHLHACGSYIWDESLNLNTHTHTEIYIYIIVFMMIGVHHSFWNLVIQRGRERDHEMLANNNKRHACMKYN